VFPTCATRSSSKISLFSSSPICGGRRRGRKTERQRVHSRNADRTLLRMRAWVVSVVVE
jgi:hypothetical protein